MPFTGKSILFTHVYNEEYLLPFWLKHHRDLFDHLVVIDYNSTDSSIEICKKMWPDCTVVTTKNKDFDSTTIDSEVMYYEYGYEGIKLALNTTEFLFCEKPLKDIFDNLSYPVAYNLNVVTPYSSKLYTIHNYFELFKNMLNSDVVFHRDRGVRIIHTHTMGKYKPGRHDSYLPRSLHTQMHIVWLGFYPMNDLLLQRKLQIGEKVSQADRACGRAYQHLFSKEKMLSINEEKANSGTSLNTLNPDLYTLLTKTFTHEPVEMTGNP